MDRIKTAMRILRYGVYVVGEVLLKEEGLREFQGEIARLVGAESQGKTDNFAPRRKSLDT